MNKTIGLILLAGLALPCLAAKADALTFTYGGSRGATLLSNDNSTTIQTWSTGSPYSAHLSDSGSVWYTSGNSSGSGSCAASGAPWSTLYEKSWTGTTLRTITSTNLGGGNPHHAITPTSKGTILAILLESRNGSCGEKIVEYDPKQGKVIWSWHTGDHEGSGASKLQRGSSSSDPYHINNVDYDPTSNKIVFSAHNVTEVMVIDRSIDSTAAQGTAGDIQWRIGKPANYGITGGTQFISSAVHSARWVKPGYPGAGNVIFYANQSPYNSNYSTGYEFTPVYSKKTSGEWDYSLVFMGTNGVVSNSNQGGMDKVYNGNWIVTYSSENFIMYEFDATLGASQAKAQAVGSWASAGNNGGHRYPVCYGAIAAGVAAGDAEATTVYNAYCVAGTSSSSSATSGSSSSSATSGTSSSSGTVGNSSSSSEIGSSSSGTVGVLASRSVNWIMEMGAGYVMLQNLSGNTQVRIQDSRGVVRYAGATDRTSLYVPTGALPQGLYFLEIIDNGQQSIRSIPVLRNP